VLFAFFWVFFTSVAFFLQYFDTVGWVTLLTCKTVSQITYTVLVETVDPAESVDHLLTHSLT